MVLGSNFPVFEGNDKSSCQQNISNFLQKDEYISNILLELTLETCWKKLKEKSHFYFQVYVYRYK